MRLAPLAQAARDRFSTNPFAAIKTLEPAKQRFVQFFGRLRPGRDPLLFLFEPAQPRANDLAGRLVKSGGLRCRPTARRHPPPDISA